MNFIDLLTPGTPERIAITGGGISAATRSGATGPEALLQLASLPTTCWFRADGTTGFGGGPYPACDPANDTGDGGNTDCIGLGGAPVSFNPCLPFRELTLIDWTQDACAACDALDGPGLTTGCATSGYCAALSDPWFALEPEVAIFSADTAAEALLGFEESLFPTEYPLSTDGFTMLMLIDNDPSQVEAGSGGSIQIGIECFMGVLDGGADPYSGPSPTQVPDTDLVSIPISPCTDSGGTCGNGVVEACEECDDGNLIDGDGCQSDCTLDFCASDPIDCSNASECVVDGICDRLCEPGTGCNRCRGGGVNQPDGSVCAGGGGTCEVGVCVADYCAIDPVDCSATAECLANGTCNASCEPGTGCNRCPGQDQPVPDGSACDGGLGVCQSGVCGTNYCVLDPTDCSASAECLTDGACNPFCQPGAGCNRCPGRDLPGPDGTACDSGDGTCAHGICVPNGPPWGPVVLAETDESSNVSEPKVVADPSGNVTAVWIQASDVWSNRYVPGNGWGTAQVIDADTGDASGPDLAVDSAGNVVAIWVQGGDIWSNRFTLGGAWSVAQRVESSGETVCLGEPRVASDPGGNTVAVWCQASPTYSQNVWSNRYTVGSGWGVPELLETDDTGGVGRLSIAVDTNGNAIALWAQVYPDGSGGFLRAVQSNRYTPGGEWGGATTIQNGFESTYGSEVVFDPAGDATAVWIASQWDGMNLTYETWSAHFTPGAGWYETQTVDVGSQRKLGLSLADDSLLGVVAVWHVQLGSNVNDPWGVFSSHIGFGGWSGPTRIDGTSLGAYSAGVAADNAGNAVAVWSQRDGATISIASNRYVSGIGWGIAELIESGSNPASEPDITVDQGGAFSAVWSHAGSVGSSLCDFPPTQMCTMDSECSVGPCAPSLDLLSSRLE